MREVLIALASSSLTIVITSFFNYHFMTLKEIRSQSFLYMTDILKDVYTPIVKKMMGNTVPGEPYEGIRPDTLEEISMIINRNYELVDPQLDAIVLELREFIRWDQYEDGIRLVDENKRLFNHIEYNFNFYRKQLGLPFDKNALKKRIGSR